MSSPEAVDLSILDRAKEKLKASLLDARAAYENRLAEGAEFFNPTFRDALYAYILETEGYIDNFDRFDPLTAFTDHLFIFWKLKEEEPPRESPLEIPQWPLIFAKVSQPSPHLFTQMAALAEDAGSFIDKGHTLGTFLGKTRQFFNTLAYIQGARKLRECHPFPEDFDLDGKHDELRSLVLASIQPAQDIYVEEKLVYYYFFLGVALVLQRETGYQVDLDRIQEGPILRKLLQQLVRLIEKKYTNPARDSFISQVRLIFEAGEKVLAPRPDALPLSAVSPREALNYGQFEKFANTYYSWHPPAPRLAWVDRVEREIREASGACQTRASILVEPLDADVSLEGKTDCKALRRVHLTRASESASTSNLACTAQVTILFEGQEFVLTAHLDGEGALSFVFSDRTLRQPEAMTPAARNFLLEIKRLMLFGLRDHLVRQGTGEEHLRLASPGPSKTSPASDRDVVLGQIQARTLEDMFVVQQEGEEEQSEEGPVTQTIVPAGSQRLAHLLAKTNPIAETDLVDFHVTLFQEEVRDMKGEEIRIYVPIPRESYVRILEELRTGALGQEHIFLQRQKGVVKRLGYQPWKKAGEPQILRLTQRHPNGLRQDILRRHLTNRGLGTLEKEGELQFYVLSTREGLRMIVLRYLDKKSDPPKWVEVPLLTEDVALMEAGLLFEDGLSDGAQLIDQGRGLRSQAVPQEQGETLYQVACVLEVPQAIHYAQGSYLCIKEALSLLPREA